MTFEVEDGDVVEEEATLPRAVVLVIPAPGAEPELAQRVSDSFEKYIHNTNRYEVFESDEFRAQLFGPGQAAAMDCATNAVCLSGYAKELWIDVLLLGVLYKGEGGWRIEANRVGVERAEVEGYAHNEDDRLDRRDTLELDDLATQMGGKLLGIIFGAGEDKPRVRLVPMRGPMQTKLAIGTAGLAGVAAIAAGYFALQASNIESKIKDPDITQQAAWDLVDDGEEANRNAALFLGVSLVAAAGSAALFFIKPLQEVEVEAERPTPGFEEEPAGPGGGVFGPDASLVPDVHLLGTTVSLSWSLP